MDIASTVPKVKVTLTKNCKGGKLLLKEGRLLCPLGSLLVWGPCECRMMVLPHKIEGTRAQVMVGVSQSP